MKRSSLLVRILGFPATLVHGDTLVLDRWLWLKSRLPKIHDTSKRILDVGCGSGAFTVGAALRGYRTLGLSWDESDQRVARERALICRAALAEFEICDVRYLDEFHLLDESFEIAVCCENIEHILNDHKLIADIARSLKPSGTLLLTTPNLDYRPMTQIDRGPFLPIENGAHVRKGYSPEDLRDLCESAKLKVIEIGYCSGFLSQKITALMRRLNALHPLLGWTVTLPLRVLPPLFDTWLSGFFRWPGYSITLVAAKI
jgi:2-polyprenyl-3-methyl-5-hydroxy-6-metoxy-1,4-benzoquinol methylase